MSKASRKAERKKLRGNYIGFIRVAAEYGSSGLWEIDLPQQKTYGVGATLALPIEIKQRLQAWCSEFDTCSPIGSNQHFDAKAHWDKGLEIARSIKRWLGPEWYVEYGFRTEVTEQ